MADLPVRDFQAVTTLASDDIFGLERSSTTNIRQYKSQLVAQLSSEFELSKYLTTQAAQFSAGLSNLGNTLGDTGIVTNRLIFAGGNNVTLSQSTDGGGATVTISGANTVAQSVQSLGIYGSSQTVGESSSSTFDARSITFQGMGNVSVGMSGGKVLISGAGGAGGATFSAGLSNIGNTVGDTGVVTDRLVFAGGNNITLSGSTNGGSATVTISGPNTVAQSNQTVGLYGVGNTTQNSSTTLDARTISFRGNGIITVGYSNGSVQLSATVPAQTNQSIGAYALGNTTGESSSTTFDARTVSIRGDGIISVGYSNSSLRISATVPAQSVESQSIGMSTQTAGGGTAGTTGYASGAQVRYHFVPGSNITMSQSVNGASATLSIYAPTPGAGGAVNVSAGTTSGDLTQVVFSNSNGIEFGLNGSTVTARPNPVSYWAPLEAFSYTTRAPDAASLIFVPLSSAPYIEFDRVAFGIRNSNATNSTGTVSWSFYLGIYSKNVSTLSLVGSNSTSFAHTFHGTVSSWSQNSGVRVVTMGMTNTLTPGEYWQAHVARSSTGGANASFALFVHTNAYSPVGFYKAAAAPTSVHRFPGMGVYTVTTLGIPASVAFSQISGSFIVLQPVAYMNGTV